MNTETASVTHFPTFRRIPAAARSLLRAFFGFLLKLPLRSWRLFRHVFLSRKSFVVYAVGGTAVCLFYAACDWYYRRAWDQEKERITASGSSLDISKLIPPPPRDEDNFFATPVLKEFYSTSEDTPTRLTMWFPLNAKQTVTAMGRNGKPYEKPIPGPKDDSLAAMCAWLREYGNLPDPPPPSVPPGPQDLLTDHRFDDIFQELNQAAKRPESHVLRFCEDPNSIASPVFKIRPLMRMVRSLILRGRAQIAAGDSGGASDTVGILRKISDGFVSHGLLMGMLLSNNYQWSESILREGMLTHQWTDQTLADFLKLDPRPQFHKGWAKAAEIERAFGCGLYENATSPGQDYLGLRAVAPLLLRAYPDGLWLRACIQSSRFNEAWGKQTRPLAPGESWASRAEEIRSVPMAGLPLLDSYNVRNHVNFIDSFVGPCFVRVEVARTAIRLERHWLKHHRYPATLAELDPAPPEGIPLGMDGKPLRYRTNAEGSTFRVWSPRRPAPSNPDPAAVDRDDIFFANE